MLKMSVLIKESRESKSTILYCVKGGLLLEPNLHLYKEESKLIFSYSINQIKTIFNNNMDVLIKLLDRISWKSDNLTLFFTNQLLEKFNIKKEVSLLGEKKESSSNLQHKLMFYIILTLKPYIFNKHTESQNFRRG